MKARLAAAGLSHGAGPPGPDVGGEPEPASARVAQARSRARERADAQLQALRPLGLAFIAVVVIFTFRTHPAPGLHGAGLGVTIALAVYAAAVATAISVRWARRGQAAQAAASILIGGSGGGAGRFAAAGICRAGAEPGRMVRRGQAAARPGGHHVGSDHGRAGPGHHDQRRAPRGRERPRRGAVVRAADGNRPVPPARPGEPGPHRTAHGPALQDAREAEAAAAALAERTRIAGELHDVLAHSLSALAIQLQGARKLAGREQVSDALRATIERSAELARAGLADARQAVGALRGERLPTLDQLAALVEDFRRDTGSPATLRIDGTSRPIPAEASLALYRGAQEALTNITRYAAGATTAVTVTYRADRTIVTIEDHVSGPQTTTLAGAGGGHGLTAMRERVARVGGAAHAGPTGDGWLVELEVPT
jgi:signal transduction histidine kinase